MGGERRESAVNGGNGKGNGNGKGSSTLQVTIILYSAMDHIHNNYCFLKVAGDYNFNPVAFKFETCT